MRPLSRHPFAVPALAGALLLTLLLSACAPEKEESTLPAPQALAPTLVSQQTTPAQPVPAARAVALPQAAPPASVEELIAQAEALYAHGQANYSAGHLEAARDDFDAAFNGLLRAPQGVQSDDRLQKEFDRIVEATHQLELLALKAGDGFTEQHYEPAPIDEANALTFPVDPGVRARLQAELANTHSDLPLMLTDPVAGYISYFSSHGHGTIVRALERSGRYRQMIERTFREEGVPQDLIYLAQAESGFQPLALSRAGARGMWQFMPFDGLKAGLQRNWWIDERQDPEKSTRAAARLLKDLYNQFGDWYLAMAAYNSGPGTVQRAVQRTGYADFWELYRRNVLPGETRNYVPIILAITIMAKNPTQYGLDQVSPVPEVPYDTVRIHYPIDLRLAAECAETTTGVLQELNPSLLRMTTPREMDFDLHLPVGAADKYTQNVEAIPEDMRVYWRYHRVEGGESLGEIARKYHTTATAIAEANSLEEGATLERDARLIIPVAPGKANAETEGKAQGYSKKAVHYTIRKGDTVLSVADGFGVPATKLRQWNHLSGNSLHVGRALTIYRPTAQAISERRTSGHATGKAAAGKGAATKGPGAAKSPAIPASKAGSKSPAASGGKSTGKTAAKPAPAGTGKSHPASTKNNKGGHQG
jgi:membrane-bound lytic murein transglycosylase D